MPLSLLFPSCFVSFALPHVGVNLRAVTLERMSTPQKSKWTGQTPFSCSHLWLAPKKGVISRCGQQELQAKRWSTITTPSTGLPYFHWRELVASFKIQGSKTWLKVFISKLHLCEGGRVLTCDLQQWHWDKSLPQFVFYIWLPVRLFVCFIA